MVLILSGGGTESASKLTEKFLSLVRGELVGVIANARDEPERKATLEWIDKRLFPKKHKINLKLINLEKDSLEVFDGIIIPGGNTFKLLRDIKKSRYENKIIDFAKSKKPVYGISAGAIIMGSDISTAKVIDKNKVGLKDLSGFNLFSNISFVCHYEEKFNSEIREFLKGKSSEIIALPEGSGLVYDFHTKKMEFLGKRSSFKKTG